MVTLAKSDRSVARLPDDFDSDPWLLSTENGTLDLRTGKLRSYDPKDLITKLAPVAYDPSATWPNWLAFLDMIMNGKKDAGGVSSACVRHLFNRCHRRQGNVHPLRRRWRQR